MKVIQGDAGKRLDKGKGGGSGSGSGGGVVSLNIDPPKYLDRLGKTEWKRIIPLLNKQRRYSPLFQSELAKYCAAFSRWRKAEDRIKADGEIIKSPKNYDMQSPWVAISNKAQDRMASIAAEFGLTLISQIRAQGAQLDLFDAIPEEPKPAAVAKSGWDDLA